MDSNRPTSDDIKRIRKDEGMSQARFAKRLGVSQATVSKVESGTSPSDAFLTKLSENLFGGRGSVSRTVSPPKFVKPSFWKLCKLRFKYEFGLYDKAGIRPVTFDAFVRQTVIDEL